MSKYYQDDFDDENEEGDLDEDTYDGKKNVAIIVLDICPSMFDPPRPIKKCLAAIYQQYDRMLLQGPRRNLSVCFLRDDDIVLNSLSDNLIDSTRKILDLLQSSTDDLRSKLERKSPPALRYTFTECMKQFTNLEKINPYVVILTDDDDPHQGDKNQNLSAIDVALSFREMNVKLVVLPLKEQFNYDLFYGELLKSANDVPLLDVLVSESNKSYTTVEDLVDILNCIIKNNVNIRRLAFRMLENGDKEISFWVQTRYLVRSNALNTNCTLSRSTNNPVKMQNAMESEFDSFQHLISKSGSENIRFNKNECWDYKMPNGFRLLRVTNKNEIKMDYLNKRGFIVQKDELTPEDQKYQKYFDYMWEFCKKFNSFLICGYFVPGNRQYPHKVQLSPEAFYGKPCFVAQFLSNSDEIAYVEEEDKQKEISKNDPRLEVLNEMIDKLMINNYTPSMLTCPVYETKASILKSILLNIDRPEVCHTLPTEDEVNNKLGQTGEKLAEIFGAVAEPTTKRSRKK